MHARHALLVSVAVPIAVAGFSVACGRVGFDLTPEHGGVPSGAHESDASAAGGASNRDAAVNGSGGRTPGGGGTISSGGGLANGGAFGIGGTSGNGGATPHEGGIVDAGVGGAIVDASGAGGVGVGGAGTGGTGTGGAGTGGTGTGGAGTGGTSPLGTATSVSAGELGTCAVANAGKLYCWGTNTSSALGGAGGASSASPVLVQGPGSSGGFVEVAVGSRYGCARHTNGTVYCWGENVHGQLGAGDTGIRPTPNPVNLPKAAQRIAAHYALSCSVLADGTLDCWGQNDEGEMGQNESPPYVDQPSPIQVPSTEAWRFSSPGQGSVCGLRSTGSLYCWGRNTYALLGQGTDVPIQIRTPTRSGTDSDWTTVSVGQLSACAIRAGLLYCWGENAAYELGTGDNLTALPPTRIGTGTDWTSVSIDTFHACGLRAPGTLWCWGRNAEGQLGITGDPVKTPTQVGARTDWVEVTVGRFHTCARRADLTIWCTGEGLDGRLGIGTMTRPYAFTQIAPYP